MFCRKWRVHYGRYRIRKMVEKQYEKWWAIKLQAKCHCTCPSFANDRSCWDVLGVSKKKEDSSDSSQKTPRNLWSMAFIELPPSFLCTGSRPAPPSSLPLMARPLPPKWRSSAGGAARGCAWRKVPRIARVALNLLGGHDGIHDALMVILKRMMLQDVIGYYSRPFTRMHWWNIQMWKEGLRVGQSLHRHGCLWQLFCGTEREAFGHRLLPDIVTWQWFLAHVSVPTKAVWLKSIVSCWWQFVIDIIVQVRHRTEYFLAKDAQQEASTQLRLDPWQGSWAFGHREVPALRNCKYQMNWLATIVISTNRPMKLNQNGTWFTVQVVRHVGVHWFTPVNLNRIDPLLDRLLAEHEEEIAEKDNALRLSTMT